MARVKNLQDRFSVEDITKAALVKHTYDCGYSRIALTAVTNDDIYRTSMDVIDHDKSVYSDVTCISLKFFYAIMVFQRAVLLSYHRKQFNPYWHVQWGGEMPFYELVQVGSNRKHQVDNSIAAFWNLLQNVANLDGITVHEQLWVDTSESQYSRFFFPNAHNAAFCLILKDVQGKTIHEDIKDLFTYPYDTTPVSYTWDEIKEYFVELTLKQLSLTMPHLMHGHTAMDDFLFEACRTHDLDSINFALSKGAHVNALTDEGESVLQLVIEGHKDDDETIKLIDVLLDAGADVDLFGFSGLQPLLEASYLDSVEIVRHLLEKGSNPNYNSYLTDYCVNEYDKNVSCSILSRIDTKESFECLSDSITPEMLQIKDLVIQYGGKLFRDDAVWTETENEE